MLLVLILTKQFTKRWPCVARSGDERSPLPAAVVRRRTGSLLRRARRAPSRESQYNNDDDGFSRL